MDFFLLDWCLNPLIPEMFIDVLASYLTEVWVAESNDGGYCLSLPTADDGKENYTVQILAEMRHELVRQSKLLCRISVLVRSFIVGRPLLIAHPTVAVAMDIMNFPVGTSRWFASLPLERNPDETRSYIACLHWLSSKRGHVPTKVFIFPPFSSSGGDGTSSGDDDKDVDTDTSSLTSDVTPSVSEGSEDVLTRTNYKGACHEVGCNDVAELSKRRRIP
jgi:hypothetical protein